MFINSTKFDIIIVYIKYESECVLHKIRLLTEQMGALMKIFEFHHNAKQENNHLEITIRLKEL